MEPHFRHLYEPAVDKVGTRVHLAGHKDVRLGHVHLGPQLGRERRDEPLVRLGEGAEAAQLLLMHDERAAPLEDIGQLVEQQLGREVAMAVPAVLIVPAPVGAGPRAGEPAGGGPTAGAGTAQAGSRRTVGCVPRGPRAI